MIGRHVVGMEYMDAGNNNQYVDPALRRSPLAEPQGRLTHRLPDCESCDVRGACSRSVIGCGPFARDVCEAASGEGMMPLKPGTLKFRTMELLQRHPGGLRCAEILTLLGGSIHRSTLTSALAALQVRGDVIAAPGPFRANEFLYISQRRSSCLTD